MKRFLVLLFLVPFALSGQNLKTKINTDIRGKIYDPAKAANMHQAIVDGMIAVTAAGTNTYTATVNAGITSYQTGYVQTFTFTNANSSTTCSININGLGVKSLKKISGGSSVDLAVGDIGPGETKTLSYDGTNFQVLNIAGSGGGGGGISGLTSGRVVVATSATTIGDDANLVWDAANKRLDLRTASRIRFQRNDNALNFEMGLFDPIATNDFVINAVTSPTGFQFQQLGTTVFGITNLQRFNFNNKVFFNTSTGSALADFQSTNQGLVLPRALRSAITTSENGMLTVDTNVPYFHNGTAWSAIPTAPTALGTSLQVLRTNAGGTATEWATISGGITNTAANNELMMSNGTNAVPSGFFKGPNLGDITLGNSSLSGGQRYISVFGSAPNIELVLQSLGTGRVLLSSAGDITLDSDNVVRITASPTSNGGITVSSDGSTHNTIESSFGAGSFNIYAVGQGFAAAAGQDLNIRAGQAGSIGVQNAGNLNLSTNTPNGGGTEGAVNIQTRSAGRLGFFNTTAVVKQSAVTTPQGLMNGLVAYGLFPASTLNGVWSMTSPDITTSITTPSTSFNLLNTTATTVNAFGAANVAINMGANGGTFSLLNPTVTLANATSLNLNGASPSIATSSLGTASVFNTNVLTGNLFGAATTLTIGATTGTLNLRNVTLTAPNATSFAMNGASPSITTTNTGTASLFNTAALTGNLFGAATTINIGHTATAAQTVNMFTASTGASTYNIATGATAAATTKTINIGTGGVASSTTNINIGTTNGGQINLNRKVVFQATETPGGTTGNQTINLPSGSVNFAAGATSIVVTNSLATTTSHIFCTLESNDATAVIKNVVRASGSFTINLNAAATAETRVGFFVIN